MQLGEQTQQATLWKPSLHFGYQIAPHFSQPIEFSLLHLSSSQIGYPTPLPYDFGFKQSAPVSVKSCGHDYQQTGPTPSYPSLHSG